MRFSGSAPRATCHDGLPAMTVELGVAVLAFAIWLYLLFFRGGFWLGRQSDVRDPSSMGKSAEGTPRVVAVVPARDEADVLPASLRSLLGQDYAPPLTVIVVDDQSEDDTSEVARHVAADARREIIVLRGEPRPPGWTGKVWAMQQGIAHAATLADPPRYLLLTDADIAYAPDALTHLVARARAGGLKLTSLMAKLNCESLAERALIPAFIFFFQMLYPFAWVGRATMRTAAAAGGCMLVEKSALERAGGIAPIRNALIDDCALAALMKAQGPIWLGLTERAVSLRPYPHLDDIRRMVSRSAYAQLGYSRLLLAGTLIGMVVTYLAAPLLAIFGSYPSSAIAITTWLMMAIAFQPTLRFYSSSPLWGLALPLIAAAYLAFTMDSAYQHWRGRGGMWKGRPQAMPEKR
jgi:hopene-associated glycosyltransferase HpnB